jgi:type I restriction enzyme S subunit
MKELALSEVATITMGMSPKGETYNSECIGMPLLNGPTEFGSVHPFCTLFTTDSKRNCEMGDLIFCVRGSTTGKMNWADRPYSLGRGVCSIRGIDLLETKYIRYCIEYRLRELLQLAGGATFPNLTTSDLASFRIPFSEARRKIATILSTYHDLIENNTRRIKILEEMAQMLYQEWFIKFRFPGHEKVKMAESEHGLIPERWKQAELGDISQEVRRNVSPDTIKPNTPYFGLEHLPRKSIALSDWGKAVEVQSTKLKFYKGEILFGKIRPYFHKVGVAPVNGICSTDAIVIIPQKPEWFGVTLSCVSSDAFVSYATQTSQGTKMPRANWDVLVKFPIILPPEPILAEFNNHIETTVDLIHKLIMKNRNLWQTRDLLLPKLISGNLDVESLDSVTN